MDEQTLRSWRSDLRARLIAHRLGTSAEERSRWGAVIDAHLEQLLSDVSDQIIAFCWPYQAEYDARALMLRFLARGARAALPVVVAPRTPMVFRQWTPEMKMVAGVYDIPVPVDSSEVTPDVVLAALAGFDDECFRLGYGAGFFDRTFAAIEPKPTVIGVGFEIARVPTIYPQWHDIPMDYVVTEAGVRTRDKRHVHECSNTARSMCNGAVKPFIRETQIPSPVQRVS
jgi:5-formyltetrahydrofolate cyclo-ligase